MSLPDGTPVDLGFDQFTKREELELQFIKALSEARFQDMKTASVEEHIVNQRLTNRTKARSLREFEISIQRFNLNRAEQERRIDRIRLHAMNLNYYRLGDRVPGMIWQNVWSAYKFFLQNCPFDLIYDWGATPIDPTYFRREHYIFRTLSGGPVADTTFVFEPHRDNSNVSILLAYQNEHYAKCVVKAMSPPHLASCEALSALSQYASKERSALETAIADLQAGVYDLWKPQELIKLADSPVT